MAQGTLYRMAGPAVLAISNSIESYTAKHKRAPACVRLRAEALGVNPPAEVAGVRVVTDERVQPGHVLLCGEVEP